MSKAALRVAANVSFLFVFLGAIGGCSQDSGEAGAKFESDTPYVPAGNSKGGEFTDSDDQGGNASAGAAPVRDGQAEEAESPERAIVEADIVQLQGNRLYAMSRIGGLSVIDATDPEQLELLGRYRELSGTPFEMYLQDGVIFAMFNSWGEYVADEADNDRYSYVQTSKLLALDVGDPAHIAKLGSFDVPGSVSDSRIVGKVLYVASHEDGYCWGCAEQKARTSVISLDIGDPHAPRKVDQLFFGDDHNYGWIRSVTVTEQRMYVAGPEYGTNGPTGSTIQVIDIADPAGDMVEGATLKVAGQISSRWQIDEYQGVLRVISQPASWTTGGLRAPSVQTFRIDSSHSLSPLGTIQLKLPDQRESLRSVRFDGPRAYAITALQQDPLFTIDLSDPDQPRQMGELHMPGFVYHMEPRGDRVIGLGFDQGNREGAIAVSVFDVSDLAAPKMLSRANFGGDWASLPEDQDRIHKAFRIVPELGLVLVPFSGWSNFRRGEEQRCVSSYQSGVQLLDLNGDTLRLRGTAPSMGEARRALIHQGHLLSISDARVETYDIRDRDAPTVRGGLAMARYVEQVVPLANGIAARVNASYWSEAPWIDLVDADQVDAPHRSLGTLSLGEALRGDSECSPYSYIQAVFGHDSQLEILYRRYEYSFDYRDSNEVAGVLVVDASDPSAPALRGKLEWDMNAGQESSYQWYSDFADGVGAYNPNAISYARAGQVLVALETSSDWSGSKPVTKVRLRTVDLSDPSEPRTRQVALPTRSYTGMSVSGDDVLLGFFEPGARAGSVRFYVQAVDVTDPAEVTLGKAINVPGMLMHHAADTGRILTSQLTRIDAGKLTQSACSERFGFFEWEYPKNHTGGSLAPPGACVGYRQTLQLARLDGVSAELEDSLELEETRVVSSSSAGSDRVFAVLGARSYYVWDGPTACPRCGASGSQPAPAELLVLSGFRTGQLESGRLGVEQDSQPWWGFWGSPPVHAHGTRALLTGESDLSLIDASDVSAPVRVRSEALFGNVNAVTFQDDQAFLALGEGGAQRVSLR
jgi:uncharacterized secreted protein with C-terminal beta-propeller domain